MPYGKLAHGNTLGILKCVHAQPSPCCFLDAEGLVPPKLLQLAFLLSTCATAAQYNGCGQPCLHEQLHEGAG
jgi:hypothetical protein